MEEILNVLIRAASLKDLPRSGWVLRGIKNPETVAQHSFRTAIMVWVFASRAKHKLDVAKLIKISLAHDLCEVYAGDIPPYLGLLPKDPAARREMLKHALKLPKDVRERRELAQHTKELASLEKLTADLPPALKKEITQCWLDYERMRTAEGRFARQVDKIESLLQSIEYWGPDENSPVVGWWSRLAGLSMNLSWWNF